MNTALRQTLTVARWEFRRFFKWKDVVTLFGFMLLGVFASQLLGKVFEDSPPSGARIGVADPTGVLATLNSDSTFVFERVPAQDVDQHRQRVLTGDLDGLLVVHAHDSLGFAVTKRPAWRSFLIDRISTARKEAGLERLNVTAAQVEPLFERAELHYDYVDPERGRRSKGELIVALLIIVLLLMGIWISAAQLFVAITGEKQQRVTEFVLSAIPPQTWIDGKILGLAAVGMAYVIMFALLAVMLIGALATSGLYVVPVEWTVNVGGVLQILLLSVLGYFFWFYFIGGIASTITDPNSSSRGMFLMLPFAPMIFALAALKDADTFLMQVLSQVPFTSSTVLPARIALTEVGWWEVPLALLVLLGSIALLRLYAGKVFSFAILMTGKEPSWREIANALRKS